MSRRMTHSSVRIGRRPKPKDEVLVGQICVCLPRATHAEILREAAKAGLARAQLLRLLVTAGLKVWQRHGDDLNRLSMALGLNALPSSATARPVAKRGV